MENTISARLRTLRSFLNLTIEEMASLTGTTKSAFNRWENDQSLPKLHHLKSIVAQTHCNELWLINGRDDEVMFPPLKPQKSILTVADFELIAKHLGYSTTTVQRVLLDDMLYPVPQKTKERILDYSTQYLTSKNETLANYIPKTENQYLWAKIAEMEQKQLKYLIDITEPYNQTPAY